MASPLAEQQLVAVEDGTEPAEAAAHGGGGGTPSRFGDLRHAGQPGDGEDEGALSPVSLASHSPPRSPTAKSPDFDRSGTLSVASQHQALARSRVLAAAQAEERRAQEEALADDFRDMFAEAQGSPDDMFDAPRRNARQSMARMAHQVNYKFLLSMFGGGAWCFLLSFMLFALGKTYEGDAVDYTRSRFAAIRSQRASAEAAVTLSGGLAAYDALDYALQRKLYVEPLDYGAIKRALAPVFALHRNIRGVDITYIDRNASLTIRRALNESLGIHAEDAILLQSNTADCYEALGALGCLSAVPGQEQPWYAAAVALPGNQESDRQVGQDYPQAQEAFVGSSFRWLDGPRFVHRDENTTLEASAASARVTWSPAYSLIFRSVFPGSFGELSLVGRVTLEISQLSRGGRLNDPEWLGPDGAVLVCDRQGNVIGSPEIRWQVAVDSPTGRVRARKAWELPKPWASGLVGEDFSSPGGEKFVEGFYVTITPLVGRGLEHFSILLAAERTAFVDEKMQGIADSSDITLALPYPVLVFIFCCWLAYREHLVRQELRRVHNQQWKELDWDTMQEETSMGASNSFEQSDVPGMCVGTPAATWRTGTPISRRALGLTRQTLGSTRQSLARSWQSLGSTRQSSMESPAHTTLSLGSPGPPDRSG